MRGAAAFITIALLAGCSQAGDGNNMTASAAGTGGVPASGGVAMQPGEWESTIQVSAANMPQMPPGVSMPGMQPITARFCITPEQAANPNADVLGGSRNASPAGCTTENFSFAGGRISGTTTCNMGRGTMRTAISGQFTPTTYEMTLQSSSDTGGAAANSEMRISARRIGDCPAR